MALRCLLFSSDEGTAQPICRTLADLGIEAEHCSAAVQAVERVTGHFFHLVIVDWDNQPEAAFLLNTARERKAAERPMSLAIVGNDASVPQALQAGANSILRKPIQVNQVKDTLSTAQGLLRAKYEPAPAAQAAAAAAASGGSAGTVPHETATLRAGEFLQSGATPSTQFVTESEIPKVLDQAATAEIDPLKDLEPMAAAVETSDAAPAPPPPEPDEPRGLSWYMKARVAPAPPTEPAPAKAELPSFSDTPSHSEASAEPGAPDAAPAGTSSEKTSEREQRAEAVLFAYITGEGSEETEPKPLRKFGKLAVAGVVAVALVIAYVTVPQSLWRPRVKSLIARTARAGHNWLNPQPVTTPQAPPSHENFGRAGDEYKLPVAENIPDATTDPSQIRVLPVIDPTAKQPNGANAGAGQNAVPVNTAAKDVPDPSQPDPIQVQENQNPGDQTSQPPQPGSADQATESQPAGGAVQTPAQSVPAQVHVETTPAPAVTTPPTTVPPAAQRNPQPRTLPASTSTSIPSSLKSQMASTTPEASGNKPVEAALPSIEPVELPEAAARSLLLQQPDPVYPENAKGQQGTVVLELLIGRDGSVQDAKFLQGSLAFARAATDAVRQWRFKPYTLNTHPASVRTVITLNFRPAS
ncbi:MAG: TonB family protein [Acidobacteriia bacterium]|nr:TonB family protein [Terriglobia bacterium]